MLTIPKLSASHRQHQDWQTYFFHFKSNFLAPQEEVMRHVEKLEGQYSDSLVFYVHDFCLQRNVFVSESFSKVLGYPVQSSLEIPYFIFQTIYPEDMDKMLQKGKQAFEYLLKQPLQEQQNAQLRFVYRIVKPDGQVIRVLDHLTLTEFDVNGKVSIGVGYMLDVTSILPFSDQLIVEVHLPNGTCRSLGQEELHKVSFSPRELEILRLIEAGFSSKEIASRLKISVNTVHNHRQKMMQRYDCHNMLEVLREGKEKGFL